MFSNQPHQTELDFSSPWCSDCMNLRKSIETKGNHYWFRDETWKHLSHCIPEQPQQSLDGEQWVCFLCTIISAVGRSRQRLKSIYLLLNRESVLCTQAHALLYVRYLTLYSLSFSVFFITAKGICFFEGLFFQFLSLSVLSTLFSQIVIALNLLTTEHWDLLEDFVWFFSFFPRSHAFDALKLTCSLVIISAGLPYVSQKLTHRYFFWLAD